MNNEMLIHHMQTCFVALFFFSIFFIYHCQCKIHLAFFSDSGK